MQRCDLSVVVASTSHLEILLVWPLPCSANCLFAFRCALCFCLTREHGMLQFNELLGTGRSPSMEGEAGGFEAVSTKIAPAAEGVSSYQHAKDHNGFHHTIAITITVTAAFTNGAPAFLAAGVLYVKLIESVKSARFALDPENAT